MNENNQLNTILNENKNQIDNLKEKQIKQTQQLKVSIDVDQLKKDREDLVNQGINLKNEKANKKTERESEINKVEDIIREYQRQMTEAATLGKQAKDNYNTFKSGKCPTCGHDIDPEDIDKYKETMNSYAVKYRNIEALKKTEEEKIVEIKKRYEEIFKEYDAKMDELRTKISKIDAEIKSYNDSVQLLNDNYDELIKEYESKIAEIEEKIKVSDQDIGEWNDMNELFSKTLRYSLLDTLIPHINKSIKYYLDKLNQLYNVE